MSWAVCNSCGKKIHWRAGRGTKLRYMKCPHCGGSLRAYRNEKVNLGRLFPCHFCSSDDVERIYNFENKRVEPDDKYNDGNNGIVVKCRDCGEITGYLIILTGVLDADYVEDE